MGPRRLLALLLLAGCAAVPQPAAIRFGGHGDAEARVNHVEGKPVFAASPIELPAGLHTLGVICRVRDAQGVQREITATLAAGGRYRVEASMEPNPCTLTLVDEASGKPVGTAR